MNKNKINEIFFLIKAAYSLIYIDVIFPIQSSEFIKSLNFGSNLKKNCNKKNLNLFIFHLEIDFYRYKNICCIWNRIFSDRSKLDLFDETIRIQNFHFSLKLWCLTSLLFYKPSESVTFGSGRAGPVHHFKRFS